MYIVDDLEFIFANNLNNDIFPYFQLYSEGRISGLMLTHVANTQTYEARF